MQGRLRRARSRALLAAAERHEAAGDQHAALLALRAAARLDPAHPAAGHAEALLRHRLGQSAVALRQMQALVQRYPQVALLHNDLANLLVQDGRLEAAAQAYRRAIELAPEAVDPRYNLGLCLVRGGRPRAALAEFEAALQRAPDDAGLRAETGKLYLQFENLDAARKAFAKARRLDPGNADACCGLGSLAMVEGARQRARRWFRRALRLDPAHPLARLQWVRSASRLGPKAMDETRQALAAARDADAAATLHFALAHIQDRRGDRRQAASELREANRLARPRGFDAARLADQVSALIETFSRQFFAERAAPGEDSPRPVYIAGAPRSGTTLAEQIIASHPHAAGVGERAWLIDGLRQHAPRLLHDWPVGIDAARAPLLRDLARDYLARLAAAQPSARRVAAKPPSLVQYLGLAALLFPRGSLVECRRDPLDTGLSLWFERFTQGNLPFAYDLSDIGAFLREHERLMAHWRAVFGARLYQHDYARLIEQPEAAARALIGHCGLDWRPECLAFFNSRRPVSTASAWQVRKPLYRSSLGRAAAYAEALQPLRESLRQSPPWS